MISESTLQLIRSAKKIAVAIADESSLDQIGAALGLLNFSVSQNKKVDFLFTNDLPPQFSFLAPYFPEESPASAKTDELRDFIISLDAKKHGVEEIRYEKKGGALSIILGAKRGIASADISVKSADDYDLIVSFDIPKRAVIAAKAGSDAPQITHAPILLLSRDAEQKADADAIFIDTETSSWCELVWNLIAATNNGQKITEAAATPLLTGLFSATENLQSHKTTVASAKLASQLVECGAKQELVRKHLEKKQTTPAQPLNLMQLWGRALSRSRLDETTNILWSFLPAEDFLKTGSTSQNMPFIFSQMEHAVSPKSGFLYIFENPHKNHIRAILKSKDASLLSRAAQYEAGELSSETLAFHKVFSSFAEAEETLRVLLGKIL